MAHRNHPVTDYRSVLTPDAYLIDVRQPIEVAAGTLPGAVNIPLDDLPDRLAQLDRTRRIVLLCRSGSRSAHAAAALTMAGFDDVVNLEGGMLAVEP